MCLDKVHRALLPSVLDCLFFSLVFYELTGISLLYITCNLLSIYSIIKHRWIVI